MLLFFTSGSLLFPINNEVFFNPTCELSNQLLILGELHNNIGSRSSINANITYTCYDSSGNLVRLLSCGVDCLILTFVLETIYIICCLKESGNVKMMTIITIFVI